MEGGEHYSSGETKPPEHREAIRHLFDMAAAAVSVSFSFRPTAAPALEQSQMRQEIQKIEVLCTDSEDFEAHFSLASAWSSWLSLYVRGEHRKPILEKILAHLECAYEASAQRHWDIFKDRMSLNPQQLIGSWLGALLIEETQIRDLDRGLDLLGRVYRETGVYEPVLCTYIDGLYKSGHYLTAADVAEELHERAKTDPRWRDQPPPGPRRRAAKALRAEVKRLLRNHDLPAAHVVLTRLIRTGESTENDRRLLRRRGDSSEGVPNP